MSYKLQILLKRLEDPENFVLEDFANDTEREYYNFVRTMLQVEFLNELIEVQRQTIAEKEQALAEKDKIIEETVAEKEQALMEKDKIIEETITEQECLMCRTTLVTAILKLETTSSLTEYGKLCDPIMELIMRCKWDLHDVMSYVNVDRRTIKVPSNNMKSTRSSTVHGVEGSKLHMSKFKLLSILNPEVTIVIANWPDVTKVKESIVLVCDDVFPSLGELNAFVEQECLRLRAYRTAMVSLCEESVLFNETFIHKVIKVYLDGIAVQVGSSVNIVSSARDLVFPCVVLNQSGEAEQVTLSGHADLTVLPPQNPHLADESVTNPMGNCLAFAELKKPYGKLLGAGKNYVCDQLVAESLAVFAKQKEVQQSSPAEQPQLTLTLGCVTDIMCISPILCRDSDFVILPLSSDCELFVLWWLTVVLGREVARGVWNPILSALQVKSESHYGGEKLSTPEGQPSTCAAGAGDRKRSADMAFGDAAYRAEDQDEDEEWLTDYSSDAGDYDDREIRKWEARLRGEIYLSAEALQGLSSHE